VALEAEVKLDNLDLAKYQPYLAKVAPMNLKAGVLQASGTVRASQPESDAALQASYQGGFQVTGLDLDETITGDKLIGWGDLKVSGIDARLEPMSADVREVDIDNAGLEITVAENGTINLLEFMTALETGEEAASGAGLPPVHIARTRLNDCYGIYTDKTVSGPFRMALTPIDGTITAITTDSSAPAVLDIDAGIESGGLVRVEGKLDPFDYQRLTDLGIEPFITGSAVIGIVAQRLVRRICAQCREEVPMQDEWLVDLDLKREKLNGKKFYRGKGCEICNNTGYKGRVGLFELMVLNDELRDMIMANTSIDVLREAAENYGMVGLRTAALNFLFDGVTTTDEVIRETITDV